MGASLDQEIVLQDLHLSLDASLDLIMLPRKFRNLLELQTNLADFLVDQVFIGFRLNNFIMHLVKKLMFSLVGVSDTV